MLSLSLDAHAELRALEPWNATEFADFTEANREFLAPWLPWAGVVVDVDSARTWLQRYADRQAADDGRVYGIWDRGELVGGTLFRVFDARNGQCELGVWLSPSVTGRGLVSRAATHMIDWAVEARGMSRVEWLCDTNNNASKTVAARLGMTHEGTLRKLFPMGDRRVDTEVWSVLADEWRQHRAV